MKTTDTMILTLNNKFSLKDRFKVLFGHEMVNQVVCEITGEMKKNGKMVLGHKAVGMKTFLGRPAKQPLGNLANASTQKS